jgi:hypothetical protein
MKLLDSILLAVMASFMVMGVYHTYRFGILYGYSHFMVVVLAMFWLNIRQSKQAKEKKAASEPTKNTQKTKKK